MSLQFMIIIATDLKILQGFGSRRYTNARENQIVVRQKRIPLWHFCHPPSNILPATHIALAWLR